MTLFNTFEIYFVNNQSSCHFILSKKKYANLDFIECFDESK